MKILFVCLGIILLVSFITYLVGTILEYRKKKIVSEIDRQLNGINNEE